MDQAASPNDDRTGPLRFRASPEDERLGANIDELEIEFDRRGNPAADWAVAASKLLDRARAERAAGRFGSAWSSLNASRRELIDSFGTTELEIARTRLRGEAGEKLTNWRGPTVDKLLEQPSTTCACESAPTVTVDVPNEKLRLKEAQAILDDHLYNNYWKIDILKREARRAGMVLALVLVLTVIALLVRSEVAGAAAFMSWTWDYGVIMVLGALGAAVSGLLNPLSADRATRIPDLRAQVGLAGVRPFLGAGAAVIVVTLLNSGLGGLKLDAAAVPAAAMLAGFSERILGQSVAMASAAVGK